MNDSSENLSRRLRRSFASEKSTDVSPELSPDVVHGAADRRAPRLVNHGRVTRAASLSVSAARNPMNENGSRPTASGIHKAE